MNTNDPNRARQPFIAGLLAITAAVVLGGSLLAQSPSVPASPSGFVATGIEDAFPTAEEVSEVLGVSVESRGTENGLSQLWEGSDFDPQALPGARLEMYASPPETDPETLTGVIIDIVHFETAEDAVRNVDDVAFGDDEVPPGFETDLAGDFVATMSFASEEGFGGSVILLTTGPYAVGVTVFATGTSEMEEASEAIVGLVLDRLPVDG